MLERRPSLPTTERYRLFNLHGGICHICQTPIDGVRQRWEIEHRVPRALIGKAADTDENMRPAHARPCHAAKTARDRDDMARAVRRQAKHMGAWRPKRPFPGRHLIRHVDGRVERRPS